VGGGGVQTPNPPWPRHCMAAVAPDDAVEGLKNELVLGFPGSFGTGYPTG
jgi:hypothetical protein